MSLSPYRLLKDAVKAIPELKYALGVAGIAAVVAIVAGFGIDFRIAVFGTLIIIGLMFVLLIFSRFAARTNSSRLLLQALILTWAFTILTIVALTLLLTSFFFSWPQDLSPDNTDQQPTDSGSYPNDPNLPKISLRYDLATVDGLPYGWVYWGTRENPEKQIALPYTAEQMHSVLNLDTGSGELGDIVSDIDVSGMSKASYSSVIANDTHYGTVVEAMSLVIDSFRELPQRYVCVWMRKGFVERVSVDVVLDPKKRVTIVFSGQDSVYHLDRNESFPMRLNIVGAEPGLYEFHMEATVSINGETHILRSTPEIVAAPDPSDSNNTLHILATRDESELASALLGLSPASFDDIAKQFSGLFPTTEEVEEILKKN